MRIKVGSYEPELLFALVFSATWAVWFLAAYLVHIDSNIIVTACGLLLGLLSPVTATLIMGYSSGGKEFSVLKPKGIDLAPTVHTLPGEIY